MSHQQIDVQKWMLDIAESIQKTDIVRLLNASNVNIARDLILPHVLKVKTLEFKDGFCDTAFGRYHIWEDNTWEDEEKWLGCFTPWGFNGKWGPRVEETRWEGKEEEEIIVLANADYKHRVLECF